MLKCGAAMTDITPQAGTHLGGSGMGDHRPAQSVMDRLHAKAVVFESGERRCCLLALDSVIVTQDFTERMRSRLNERFGLTPEAVMVHATQTHSAPGLGRFMLDPDFPLDLPPELEFLSGAEEHWVQLASERAVEAVARALEKLEPVQVGAGRAVRDRLAFNRRGITREGGLVMPWPAGRRAQPLGPVNLCYMEGPTDPEVGVLCARTDDMRTPALLLHFTCHPVNVFGNRASWYAVSADWPGVWADGMRAHCGSDCVPLVLNGCCGNINPWDPWDPEFVPDHRRMGAALTRSATAALHSIEFTDTDLLDWRLRTVSLPYREVSEERLAEVERILADHPEPKYIEDSTRIDPEWFRAASTRSVEYARRCEPQFQYQVQVFRIGDAVIVGLPGEPFVEGQLEIKVQAQAPYVFVAHNVSHYVGYLPTRAACERGGHEANDLYTYWAKLESGALERVVEETVRVVGDVY